MRRSHKRLAFRIAIVLALVGIGAYFYFGLPAIVDDGETVLHRGNGAEPESLDPHKSRSIQASDVLRDIGEGLVG